ncbi:NAD-binding protein [Methylacidiphilum caldifontis]|uniref:NAD-binding protein n=1 Tax=Methylacidiphilum caldifontis TaxID=2795386 RepID=UPI001A8F483C|nr:NAD-binding protein [Methylacidiphilum caldifontis]QSR89147.1 NAD-binding protein [Methylacidiphilum caldifontis]
MNLPVVIVGCGYIGRLLALRLKAQNKEVLGIVKTEESRISLERESIPALQADITDSRLPLLLPYASAFVFSASSSRSGVEIFEQIFSVGLDHVLESSSGVPFVLISSTSLYSQVDGEWVDENSASIPTTPSGIILKKAEDKVLDRGGTVLRASGIYGPQRTYRIRGLLENKVRIDPRKKWINQIHGSDLAAAIEHFLTIPGLFNISDDLPTLEEDFYGWLCQNLDVPLPPIEPRPPHLKRGYSNKRISNKKAKSLGFTLDFPTFKEGYSSLIQTYKNTS